MLTCIAIAAFLLAAVVGTSYGCGPSGDAEARTVNDCLRANWGGTKEICRKQKFGKGDD